MIYYYTYEFIDDCLYNKGLGYITGDFIGTEEEWEEYRKSDSEAYGTTWRNVKRIEATKEQIEWANQFK